MAQKKNRKGRKRRKTNRMLIYITAVIILAGATIYAFFFHNLTELNKTKEEELQELEEEYREKTKELNKKTYELNYYQSDENIEKVAREELGLVMPQEIVFIQSN
ncbi:MAG: septum formation initiator family protein [Clostridia bacterium]|nr:septum formation initiator family protein [Clostridia bacterium]